MLAIHSSIHPPNPSTYPIIQVPSNFKALLRGLQGYCNSGALEQAEFSRHPLFSHPQTLELIRHPQLPIWDPCT